MAWTKNAREEMVRSIQALSDKTLDECLELVELAKTLDTRMVRTALLVEYERRNGPDAVDAKMLAMGL